MMSNCTPHPSPLPVEGRGGTATVTPHPLKFHQRLAASLIYGLIEIVSWTQRYRWEFHPDVLAKELGPVIFCTWHNRLALSLIMYRRYVRQKQQPHQLAGMVSASKDGGVVARILEHFGVEPVRGSTSRRGPQALLELITWAERGYDLAITPDGPRGPRYQFQDGVISLAQLTGMPIVPVTYHLTWKIQLRSWDRFQIPLPFTKCVMQLVEPVRVPREATEAEREETRRGLETCLRKLAAD